MNYSRTKDQSLTQLTSGERREAKIIPFVLAGQYGNNIPQAERLLNEYLNQGWLIAAAGGAGGDAGLCPALIDNRVNHDTCSSEWAMGFIVLCRISPEVAASSTLLSANGKSPKNHRPK
jgi:hypothetical protein